MKKFEITYNNNINGFFLVVNPSIRNLNNLINIFNTQNVSIEKGKVYLDIRIIMGERSDSFISFMIDQYKIDVSTLSIESPFVLYDEYMFKKYSELSDFELKKVYPITLRNEITTKRELNS